MQEINGILALLVLGTACVCVIIASSVGLMRRLAAWLIGRARYLEHMEVERIRARELARETQTRMLAELMP